MSILIAVAVSAFAVSMPQLAYATAVEWCSLQVGKPYNFNFLDTSRRDAFYCSQLVWAAYYDNFGIDISTSAWGPAIYPMEILDSPNVTKIYQK